MMSGGYGLMAGFGGFGMLFGLLVWVVLIALLVWGAGALFGGRAGGGETPEEILRRRYARGEISQADYERARQTLA